jgi:lysophospholipase L1-like esterase
MLKSALTACVALGLTLMALSTGQLAAEDAPGLQKGDRIVFLGDSITQAGNGPGGYVTLIREHLTEKHADLGIEVIGAGISGNKVPNLQARLERDVLSKNPTLVVIYIGINDVWHSTRGQGTDKDRYEEGLRDLIAKIKEAGSRVLLCTPSVIGEKTDGSNSLDGMLDEYADISRKVAKDTGVPMCDLRKAFQTHLKTANADNAERGVLTSDGVHLNAKGNEFVAHEILECLGDEHHSDSASTGRVFRHVVLFQFKEGVTEEQIEEVMVAFKKLPEKIDAIIDFECGTTDNIEPLNEDLTHGFIVTFRNKEGLAEYLPHAAHQEFVGLVKPRLERVVVFDYYTEASE